MMDQVDIKGNLQLETQVLDTTFTSFALPISYIYVMGEILDHTMLHPHLTMNSDTSDLVPFRRQSHSYYATTPHFSSQSASVGSLWFLGNFRNYQSGLVERRG
jgi:hypothetical protein